MRFRRLLRWTGFALASAFALGVSVVGLLLFPHLRLWLAQPPSPTQIIVQALKVRNPPLVGTPMFAESEPAPFGRPVSIAVSRIRTTSA